MPIPTKVEAHRALAPYHTTILQIIDDAWGEWRAVQEWRASVSFPPVLYHRTIANYVFDAIARRAILSFGAKVKVHVEIESQTFKLFIKNLAVRFKKAGDDKLGCSIPTQAALAFEEADGVLPGFPPETGKVEIVWLPNEIYTQINQILVVARDGDNLIWEYEIKHAGETGGVIPFPSPPSDPSGPDAGGLVKPKTKPKKQTKPGE
jgi:hypothetical protein